MLATGPSVSGPLEPILPSGGIPEFRLVPPPDYANNSKVFRDLFEHPEQWETVRSYIDSIGYYDHRINVFSDEELTAWFAMIQSWGKKLFIETGALNEWCPTGQACFDAVHPTYDRFIALGARIDAFSMDEPFHKARHFGIATDLEAVEQVADWIRLVRENYPGIAIGSIEPYPTVSLPDLQWWITNLDAKLAELGVAGIDFFCLDADWRRFSNDGSWRQVKELETFCKARGLPFSLIYWAAEAPESVRDDLWRIQVLYQGHNYRYYDGQPDEFNLQSWLFIPSKSVPESEDFTFTNSAKVFYEQIVSAPPITPTPTRTPSSTSTASPTPSLSKTPTPSETMTPTETSSSTPTSTGTPTATYHPADVNQDRQLDRWDLLLMVQDWRRQSMTGPPESPKNEVQNGKNP